MSSSFPMIRIGGAAPSAARHSLFGYCGGWWVGWVLGWVGWLSSAHACVCDTKHTHMKHIPHPHPNIPHPTPTHTHTTHTYTKSITNAPLGVLRRLLRHFFRGAVGGNDPGVALTGGVGHLCLFVGFVCWMGVCGGKGGKAVVSRRTRPVHCMIKKGWWEANDYQSTQVR